MSKGVQAPAKAFYDVIFFSSAEGQVPPGALRRGRHRGLVGPPGVRPAQGFARADRVLEKGRENR